MITYLDRTASTTWPSSRVSLWAEVTTGKSWASTWIKMGSLSSSRFSDSIFETNSGFVNAISERKHKRSLIDFLDHLFVILNEKDLFRTFSNNDLRSWVFLFWKINKILKSMVHWKSIHRPLKVHVNKMVTDLILTKIVRIKIYF